MHLNQDQFRAPAHLQARSLGSGSALIFRLGPQACPQVQDQPHNSWYAGTIQFQTPKYSREHIYKAFLPAKNQKS